METKNYINPYLAGVSIGIVLLLAFLLAGRGLGATGAYSRTVAEGVSMVAPEHAAQSEPYAAFLSESAGLLGDWLVVEIIGVFIGALLSAFLARRFRITVERGSQTTSTSRLVHALGGGLLMGLGAKLARGCTSGQGLTGGAMFSVGAWTFIACAFAMAYLVAPLVKNQWK